MGPKLVSKLSQSFYVNDLVTGANTEREVFIFYSKSRKGVEIEGFLL